MGTRNQLQTLLEELIGSRNVYFQPPPSFLMEYPCIVYKRNDIKVEFANNKPYKHKKQYQITAISLDPDSNIPDKLKDLPLCSYDRFFTADKLNHDVFDLFF